MNIYFTLLFLMTIVPVSAAQDSCLEFLNSEYFQTEQSVKDAVVQFTKPKRIQEAAPEIYICEVCNKVFGRLSALSGHKRLHERDKSHRCSVEWCGAAYATSKDLIGHMSVHAERKHVPADSGPINLPSVKEHLVPLSAAQDEMSESAAFQLEPAVTVLPVDLTGFRKMLLGDRIKTITMLLLSAVLILAPSPQLRIR